MQPRPTLLSLFSSLPLLLPLPPPCFLNPHLTSNFMLSSPSLPSSLLRRLLRFSFCQCAFSFFLSRSLNRPLLLSIFYLHRHPFFNSRPLVPAQHRILTPFTIKLKYPNHCEHSTSRFVCGRRKSRIFFTINKLNTHEYCEEDHSCVRILTP